MTNRQDTSKRSNKDRLPPHLRELASAVPEQKPDRREDPWDREVVSAKSPISRKVAPHRPRGLLLAVLIVFVLGFGLYMYFNPTTTGEQLFNRYFEPYPVSTYEQMTEGSDYLPAAFEDYQLGRYAEAVARFEAGTANPTTGPAYNFYYALSLMATGQHTQAIPLLEPLAAETMTTGLKQPAEWYLALAYLDSGQTAEAQSRLERIAATDQHPMQGQAAALLRELSN